MPTGSRCDKTLEKANVLEEPWTASNWTREVLSVVEVRAIVKRRRQVGLTGSKLAPSALCDPNLDTYHNPFRGTQGQKFVGGR